jgi:periplasmic protein TonB
MFADSFYESPWANRSRRGWTTLASFALQAAGVGLLLVLPLIYTGALPQFQKAEVIKMPAAQLEPPPATHVVHRSNAPQSNMLGTTLVAPPTIPRTIQHFEESVPPPQVDVGGVPWGTGERAANGSPVGDLVRGFPTAALPPPAPVVHSVRLSHMSPGSLVHRVQPEYPAMAKAAGIQGMVVLQAVIARDGAIEKLQVVSGHPLLAPAAMKAVAQWRYRPYILNGDAVEVETQVTVNFVLGGR